MVSQWRLVLSLSAILGGPLAGSATEVGTLGGIAASIFGATTQVGGASSLPGLAQSFFRPASSELPLSGTLSGLAAVGLPGAGGLVIVTGAGVRVGYRQAKVGFALQAAGIARFAGPGPLGVVRSGSMVVVRPRALRVARPGPLSAGCVLDEAA